jgi:hypothetical protein
MRNRMFCVCCMRNRVCCVLCVRNRVCGVLCVRNRVCCVCRACVTSRMEPRALRAASRAAQRLQSDFAVYMTADGRISMAGVNTGNVRYLADCIRRVVTGL